MNGKLEKVFGEISDSLRTGGLSAVTTYKPEKPDPDKPYVNRIAEALRTGGLSTVLRFGEAEHVPVCNLNKAPDSIIKHRLSGVLEVVKSELSEVHSAAKEAAQLAVREVLDVASGNFNSEETTKRNPAQDWPPDWNWPPRPPRDN